MNSYIKRATLIIGVISLCAFGIANKNSFGNNTPPSVKIVKRWDLPVILKEISGMAAIDKDRFACIQDETGSIFIYNINTSTIQEEIPFAPAGDYEDIALVNDTAWVLRSDGKLFEVSTLFSKATAITDYTTELTARQNVEGLCYDKNNNRLLLAIKDGEPAGKDYKGVYAFDLTTKKMMPEPVYKIAIRQELKTGNRKKSIEIMPSSIAVHPLTKELYVTDGRNSLLLILDPTGKTKELIDLNSKEFHQPEGISFHKDGEMYISNEASKGGGNILKVETIQ